MFYNIIPLIIIVISLVVIIIIVIRKFPSLAAVDTNSVTKVKEAEVRNRIISDRLKRKILSIITKLKKIISPVKLWLKSLFENLYKKTIELEKKYQKEKKGVSDEGFTDIRQKIKKLLHEAETLVDNEDYIGAEKKFIEVVALDKKNIEAYRGLAEVYFKQKQFDQAEETLRYLLRWLPEDDFVYLQLGQIAQEKGNDDLALEYLEKAVKLAPNHPKNLDHLLEICIILGKQSLAEETLKRLKIVNPENKKLEECKKRIENVE